MNATNSGLVPQNDQISRQGFGESESRSVVETQAHAAAHAAQAAVQARYVVAMQRPRDIDEVRVRLMKECRRSGFAAVAIYEKPMGRDFLRGPSIRFAEAALRCLGNVLAETTTLYDDRARRIVSVNVTDLEANVSYPLTVTIEKTVERRSSKGRTVLSERTNSYGDTVYVVEATDDEILNKERALVSKAMRTSALRILPGDLLDEAMDIVKATRASEYAQDPDAARKKMVDAFAGIGVKPSDLKAYLGHDLGTASPADLDRLRGHYTAIKEGETSWKAVMDQAEEDHGNGVEAPAPAKKAKPAPAKTEAPKADEIDAEIASIGELLDGATTAKELAAITKRIEALPARDRDEMRAAWSAKSEEIGS